MLPFALVKNKANIYYESMKHNGYTSIWLIPHLLNIFWSEARWEIKLSNMQDEAIPQTEVNHTCTSATFRNPIKQISSLDIGGGALKNILQIALLWSNLSILNT